MAFQVSAGVNVSEFDQTTVIPAVSTTEAAIGGVFRWGPVDKIVLVSSENDLVNRFGKPTNHNPETWFTAANFLGYGNKLYVSRAANTTDESGANGVLSAYANTNAVTSNVAHIVKNETDYTSKVSGFDADVQFIAKYPGVMGNSLKISICESANQYALNTDLLAFSSGIANTAGTKIAFVEGSNTAIVSIANSAGFDETDTETIAQYFVDNTVVGDIITAGNTTVGTVDLKVTNVSAVTVVNTTGTNTGTCEFTLSFHQPFNLLANVDQTVIKHKWEYHNVVDSAPGQSTYVAQFGNTAAQDEVHVVITDEGGAFTGTPGTVLEVFQNLSRASDAKNETGKTIFYKNVINDNSAYVWFANARGNATTSTAANVASSTNVTPYTKRFVAGSDGQNEDNVALNMLTKAYDMFASPEDIDISFVLQGKARGGQHNHVLAKYLIDNIVEVRKDCMVAISPDYADVVNNVAKDEENDIVEFRNALGSTSYAVMDTGYKYQYDKYNDLYRYIPLNGDVVGTCVRTDSTRDPWVSPAGYTKGVIKNAVKLAFNPNKAQRDILYKNGINPVVTFPGQGTILYGDKTLLSKPSAFDRINVRRLFIVLEKAIATASKFSLFEFNDEFTRAQFRNMVEPFLRDVQGRRGVIDFHVECSSQNNTAEVIDRNEFIGDIYVKPNRSINFVQLNFVAVRSGVEFNEIVGNVF